MRVGTKPDFIAVVDSIWPASEWSIAPGAASSCAECRRDFGIDPETPDDEAQEELYGCDEGSFSWAACEGCGSSLGGDRHPAHAIHREAFGPHAKRPNEIHHIAICVDCLLFHANGDEPENWEG